MFAHIHWHEFHAQFHIALDTLLERDRTRRNCLHRWVQSGRFSAHKTYVHVQIGRITILDLITVKKN